MKDAIAKYLEYLQSVKNSSPHTVLNYRKDLVQFLAYLSPPGVRPPALTGVNHPMIREFVAELHRTETSGPALVLQILRARRPFEGEPRASRSHSEVAETYSFGAFRGRNERLPQSTGQGGTSRSRDPGDFQKGTTASAGTRREFGRQSKFFHESRGRLAPSPRPGAPGTPLRRGPARQRAHGA